MSLAINLSNNGHVSHLTQQSMKVWEPVHKDFHNKISLISGLDPSMKDCIYFQMIHITL